MNEPLLRIGDHVASLGEVLAGLGAAAVAALLLLLIVAARAGAASAAVGARVMASGLSRAQGAPESGTVPTCPAEMSLV
ncbi:hypothetical protein ACFQ4O_03245 [Methylopila musalis]|uniref:Uncharacterized protein n=1 Tax=Methylopila musalis TaxID=1134781 RepID=A0ABW3Z4D6_9HYPH